MIKRRKGERRRVPDYRRARDRLVMTAYLIILLGVASALLVPLAGVGETAEQGLAAGLMSQAPLLSVIALVVSGVLAVFLVVKAYAAYLYYRTIEAVNKMVEARLAQGLPPRVPVPQPAPQPPTPPPTEHPPRPVVARPPAPQQPTPPPPTRPAAPPPSAPRQVQPQPPPSPQPTTPPKPVTPKPVVPTTMPTAPSFPSETEKKRCPYCGRVLPFGELHTVCPYCGRRLK